MIRELSLIAALFLASTQGFAATIAPIKIPKVAFTVFDVKPAEVSFTGIGYHEILRDNGLGGYSAPQWKDNSSTPNGTATDPGDFRFPISYTGGTKVSISAKFLINPQPPAGTGIHIRAIGPGFNFPERPATIASGQLLYPESEATAALPVGVSFLNPMVLTWQVSTDGGNHWRKVGQTGNRVYATLSNPLASAQLFETVVHLAAANGNATTAAAAIANTWVHFSGPANIKTWDGRTLFYYKPGEGFGACATDSSSLLTSPTGSGQCGSFAFLLMDAFGANGISSSFTGIEPTVDEVFLVKNWGFSATPTFATTTPSYPYYMELSEGGYGMVPPLPNDIYGDITSLTGIPGQNTATPSEKVFGRHFVVQAGATYYDPSYGVTYSGPASFQNAAVAGYGVHILGDMHVQKPGSSTNVAFTTITTYH